MLQSYVGALQLADTKEAAVDAVNSNRALIYHVNFPVQDPIPWLMEIQFNGDVICSGPSGKFKKAIVLALSLIDLFFLLKLQQII